MGTRTTADERIDDAREHVRLALDSLQDVVVGECWGHDDYAAEFQSNLLGAFHELLTIRARLKG